MQKLIFYAPNVHTGGGLVLLQALLSSVPDYLTVQYFLDERVKNKISLAQSDHIRWVKRSVADRWRAELELRKSTATNTLIFCFHGLPPVFKTTGKTIVFLQNKLLISRNLPVRLRFWPRLRVGYERLLARWRRHQVHQYVVQTSTMARAVEHWCQTGTRDITDIRILPFIDLSQQPQSTQFVMDSQNNYDFIYVASGDDHKGHGNLLDAWRRLAEDGLKPSLALTLSNRDSHLIEKLDRMVIDYSLNIQNIGDLPHTELIDIYPRCGALIFPSLTESFGLPLIEAKQAGLPILASELDYVRDVCAPTETFDPRSYVSIARAVKRHLGVEERNVEPISPDDFWRELSTE